MVVALEVLDEQAVAVARGVHRHPHRRELVHQRCELTAPDVPVHRRIDCVLGV
ncbi:hypothetical protein ACFOJ6_15980 [Gordonia humi]|uniref:hypothetical protein n=1 Tax=Gordonia humi TaxID=686429 RepID=UPI00361B4197